MSYVPELLGKHPNMHPDNWDEKGEVIARRARIFNHVKDRWEYLLEELPHERIDLYAAGMSRDAMKKGLESLCRIDLPVHDWVIEIEAKLGQGGSCKFVFTPVYAFRDQGVYAQPVEIFGPKINPENEKQWEYALEFARKLSPAINEFQCDIPPSAMDRRYRAGIVVYEDGIAWRCQRSGSLGPSLQRSNWQIVNAGSPGSTGNHGDHQHPYP